MASELLGDVPLLDVLHPPAGFTTDAAWLAAYSVDLVAVVACLIAMSGESSDGDMPPTLVATAITRLTGRVRVVAQAGRVKVPEKGVKVLRMADRWIREVHIDGRTASWHPKVALLRQTSETTTRWVLWLGSRNLTRDVSWDLGLAVVGHTSTTPSILPGLEPLATRLAERAELSEWTADRLLSELRQVRWETESPAVKLEKLMLHGAGGPSTLPSIPAELDHLLAISPFVDRTTLGAFKKWGGKGQSRRLATTPETVLKLASEGLKLPKQLELRSMLAPSEAPVGEVYDHEQYEEPHRGLHAKALLAWSPTQARALLWMGSANLTRRAWLAGKNVELTAQLDISRELAQALWDFTDSSLFSIEHEHLFDSTPAGEPDDVTLDNLRNEIAGWDPGPELAPNGGELEVTFAKSLPLDVDCEATVGLLDGPAVAWEAGQQVVKLALPPARDWTELIVVTLTRVDQAEVFLLRGTWVGGIPKDRDHHAISNLLGARAFLRWLLASLQDVPFHDRGSWPNRERSAGGRTAGQSSASALNVPSLESILRTYTRRPDRLVTIDRRVQELAEHVRVAEEERDPPDSDALGQLEAFEQQWKVIREGLLGEMAWD